MARDPDYFDKLLRERVDPFVLKVVGGRLYLTKQGETTETEFYGVFHHDYPDLDRYMGAEIAYAPHLVVVEFTPATINPIDGINIDEGDLIRHPNSGDTYRVVIEPMWKDEETQMLAPAEIKAR